MLVLQHVSQRFKACLPTPVRGWLRQWRNQRLLNDVSRFKQDGTRFVPPLASFPPMIMLDITNRCNLRCAHCYQSAVDDDFIQCDMERSLAFQLLDKIAEENPSCFVRLFCAGEPLMHPHVVDFVAHARHVGIEQVGFNTNAVQLHEDRARRLLDAGLTQIEMSLDAHSAETFERLKGRPFFERVKTNAQRFADLARQGNYPIQTSVSFVWQEANKHELDAFKRHWAPRVDLVHVRELHQHHDMIPDLGRCLRHDYAHRHPCPFLWRRMIIHHDGRVCFCESDFNAEHSVGDAKIQSIGDIWLGPAYQQLRHDHQRGRFEHPYCQSCSDWREIKWPGL